DRGETGYLAWQSGERFPVLASRCHLRRLRGEVKNFLPRLLSVLHVSLPKWNGKTQIAVRPALGSRTATACFDMGPISAIAGTPRDVPRNPGRLLPCRC